MKKAKCRLGQVGLSKGLGRGRWSVLPLLQCFPVSGPSLGWLVAARNPVGGTVPDPGSALSLSGQKLPMYARHQDQEPASARPSPAPALRRPALHYETFDKSELQCFLIL